MKNAKNKVLWQDTCAFGPYEGKEVRIVAVNPHNDQNSSAPKFQVEVTNGTDSLGEVSWAPADGFSEILETYVTDHATRMFRAARQPKAAV